MSLDCLFRVSEADGKLYQYTCSPFSITNGVSYFQRIVDNLIKKYNLIRIYAYLDNITGSGHEDCDHNANLNPLFNAAKCKSLTFNKLKCLFSHREIELLGYRVSHHKVKPDPECLHPLMQLPLPMNKSKLQSSIGMFSYYAKWIKNF